MRMKFQDKKLRSGSLAIIAAANKILDEYRAQDLILTLRQLYYQFVSRDLIANTQREYKRLGSIINDGRMCGLIDWNAIEDRGRNLLSFQTWDNPSHIIDSCADSYMENVWAMQSNYVEVWIEKEALIGVIEKACDAFRVPHFACKGYVSQSEMFRAGRKRFAPKFGQCKECHIIHLGDHDPSGLDMTRDIDDRVSMFAGVPVKVHRIALNLDQIDLYDPPPNPAKITDSRYETYRVHYGDESWELDALTPTVIDQLVREKIESLIDEEEMEAALAKESGNRERLRRIADEI